MSKLVQKSPTVIRSFGEKSWVKKDSIVGKRAQNFSVGIQDENLILHFKSDKFCNCYTLKRYNGKFWCNVNYTINILNSCSVCGFHILHTFSSFSESWGSISRLLTARESNLFEEKSLHHASAISWQMDEFWDYK